MKTNRWLWILTAALGLALALRFGSRGSVSLTPAIAARFPSVQWVNSATLSEWEEGETGRHPVLLDVRTEAEFEVSHLRGARRVDPSKPGIESLQISPDATVVVYCSVGYRSAAIVRQIERAGVSRVYNLEGGIFAWANEGRPIYRDDTRTALVHPYNRVWGYLLREDLRAKLSEGP